MDYIEDVESDDSTVLPGALEVEDASAKSKSQEVVNEAVQIDEIRRYEDVYGEWVEGVVSAWKRTHGFIKFEYRGETKSVFFHQSAVKTDDCVVIMRKGMECRLKITEPVDGKRDEATEVEARDGHELCFHMKHGATDSYDRQIEFDGEWFEGTVKFFNAHRGYGRILPIVAQLESVDAPLEKLRDVYFKTVDVDAEGFPCKVDKGDLVRFNIFSSSRGWGGMNVQQENGAKFEAMTEDEVMERREARREEYNARREEREDSNRGRERKPRREEREDSNRERERKPRRRNDRPRRNTRHREPESSYDEHVGADFDEIDAEARYTGAVTGFSMHRFGFVQADNEEELCRFGNVKNHKLCFPINEIQTDARPALIDIGQRVTFSLILLKGKVLYAQCIRDENEEMIVPERVYHRAGPRELMQEDEHVEGSVIFYNWRRGHGRVALDNDEEAEYFFHRDDLVSDDKIPGILAETQVLCQVCVDDKGAAVTNVRAADGGNLVGFFMRNSH